MNDKRTERRLEVEREMQAREKWVVDMKLDAGESRRGERGGDQNHQWTGKSST